MADVTKINGYNIKDAEARTGKTNTSVIPNNSGEIKTKYRISQKGYTNGATWYYPIAKLPFDNSGNYASAIINGRIGGWVSNNMSSVYSLVWNRDGTGIALLDIAGTAGSMSSIWNTCDIVVYTNSDTTDTIYLKCNSYFTFDIDLELFQSTAEILYDGSYLTSTPSGTLSAQASTSTKRLELVNGELLVNGSAMQSRTITDAGGHFASDTVEGALGELFTSVSNGKSAVASAITDKGVTTASDAAFNTMATNIRAIQTGITPSGTKQITANGTYDVANYANASVNVPSTQNAKFYSTRSWTSAQLGSNLSLKNENWTNTLGTTGISVGDYIILEVTTTDTAKVYQFLIKVTSMNGTTAIGDALAAVEIGSTLMTYSYYEGW